MLLGDVAVHSVWRRAVSVGLMWQTGDRLGREGDCSAATSCAPALDTFGPSAVPRKLRLPPLQGAWPAYDAAHQPPMPGPMGDRISGGSARQRQAPPASRRKARVPGAAWAQLSIPAHSTARASYASFADAGLRCLLDEHAPTPSHASLDAKRLAMFGLRCHEHIAEAR
ncbi:hypothetical protein T492DRAFT_902601 [Pavlovales sp. CCMP2436]|nr:hypothetical protein T492DRAFT_902601 [Pavlovales sp. CCMP2436]